MAESKIGPKEAQLRAMREEKASRKPSTSELRERVAAIKPKPKKAKKGAKR